LFWKEETCLSNGHTLLNGRHINLTKNIKSEKDFVETSKANMLQELFHYRKNKDLLIGTENEILLFITIQNQKSLYLISDMNKGELTTFLLPSISLDLESNYTLSIRIQSMDKDIYNQRFQFNAKSWDKIEFKPI
jgi:hypothetical protein